MARDSNSSSRAEARAGSANAREKPAANARIGRRSAVSLANAELDPNRSSMRSLSARPSNPPRASFVHDSASGPRNKRLPHRAKAVPRGPSLFKRLWLSLLRGLSESYRGLVRVGAAVSARLDQPAHEARPEPPASPRLVRILWLVGVLAMVAGGYGVSRFVQHHLTTAPAFAIDAVEIKGLSRLSRDELLEAAGVGLGMNVFAKSPDEIHARLLRHPWILSAEVRRELPSRLQIAVREREPIALLVVEACAARLPDSSVRGEDDPACEEPSSLYLVSADAKMIKRVTSKQPVDLPVITGVTRQRFASDNDLSRRVVTEGVALMQEYRNSDLARKNPIGEIHLEANDGFSLYVGEDLTYVRLGTPPFTQKLSRMKEVFERLEREHARAEYVYLDNEQRPDRVAVRLR